MTLGRPPFKARLRWALITLPFFVAALWLLFHFTNSGVGATAIVAGTVGWLLAELRPPIRFRRKPRVDSI